MIRKFVLAFVLLYFYQDTMAQQREWVQRGNFIDGNLHGAVSFVIGDYAYVGTGDNGNSTQTDFYRYDPTDDSWTAIADFPGLKRSSAVAFVLDGKGYVGTGKSGSTLYQDFWKYDPNLDQWTAITDFGGGLRRDAVAFTVNGKAYVGTGLNDLGNGTSDLWEYDPVADSWTQEPDITNARTDAIAFSSGTLGYIGCGYSTSNNNTVKDMYAYDPTTDTYERANRFDVPYSRALGVAFFIDSKGYLGLGITKKDFVIYDPSSNNIEAASVATDQTEDQFAPTGPTRRDGAIAFVVQGKAFVGLGSDGNFKNDLWSFQYATPNAPEALAISASTLTEATLTWNDLSDDELGFAIERSVDNNTSFTALVTVAANVATYTNNTLQSGKTYYYRVRATGAAASSTYSNQATVDTYITLNAPEALAVSNLTPTKATLTWTDRSDNEQEFEVERSVGDNTNYSLWALVGADTSTYEDYSLYANQVYYYRVRARGATETSLYTNEVTINTYTTPDNLAAITQETNEIALSWVDNSSLETGFVIERSTDGETFSALDTVATDITDYTDKPVTAGTDYQYRVYALVGDVDTDVTNTATAGFLASPTKLSVASATSSQIQIDWDYNGSNALHYVIERKIGNAGSFVRLDSVAISEGKAYSDATVEEVQQYTYRIKSTDATRSSVFSPEIQATTGLNAPTVVTATVQDSTVSLSWKDASQRETHYVILRFLTNGSNLVALDTVAANTTSFEDTTLPANGDYRYRVYAISTSTNSSSAESNAVTVSAKTETTEGEGEEEETTEEEGEEEETEEEEGKEEGEDATEEDEEQKEEEEVITGTHDPLQEEVVKVYPNPSNGQLSVHVGSERFAYVAVFNSQGRLVSEVQQAEQSATSTVRLDLQHFPAGMYTLRIYTARGVFVKKVAKQ